LIALALVLTVAAVLAIVLLGVFIILLPVVIISGVVYYFFPGLRNRYREQWRETETIEGEYRVVDPSQIRIDSPDATGRSQTVFRRTLLSSCLPPSWGKVARSAEGGPLGRLVSLRSTTQRRDQLRREL
jgi:hypothetical protein